MAGIFPSPTGVPASETDGGYEPALAPIGGPARFYGRECQTTLYHWALNALTSEILAAVDRLGYAYNAGRVDNLGAALADVIGQINMTLTAALDDIGDLQGDMAAAQAAIGALNTATSALQSAVLALGNDVTAIQNYLVALDATQVKLNPAFGPYTTVQQAIDAMFPAIGSMPDQTVKGNNAGATGPAMNLTMAQLAAMLPLVGANAGLVPPLSGLVSDYLAGDGAWHPFGSVVMPATAIVGFRRTTAPPGWLKANGAAVSLLVYPNLIDMYCGDAENATAIDSYRCTNPANPTASRSITGDYIVLPDFRGEFARGFDDGRNVDTGRNFWSAQGDLVKGHTHAITDPGHFHPVTQVINGSGSVQMQTAAGSASIWTGTGSAVTGISIQANVGTENRPRNLAKLYCVKY